MNMKWSNVNIEMNHILRLRKSCTKFIYDLPRGLLLQSYCDNNPSVWIECEKKQKRSNNEIILHLCDKQLIYHLCNNNNEIVSSPSRAVCARVRIRDT